jgi:hypothetical protein
MCPTREDTVSNPKDMLCLILGARLSPYLKIKQGEFEGSVCGLMGCCGQQSCGYTKAFWRNMPPPYSGFKHEVLGTQSELHLFSLSHSSDWPIFMSPWTDLNLSLYNPSST